MSAEESIAIEGSEESKQYVCFIKRRVGHRFVPYTESGDSDAIVVKSLREFLDHEIGTWYSAGKSERAELRPLLVVSIDEFCADVEVNGMNSKLASMLGWNYPAAVRLAESEGCVFGLTIHPDFLSIPFSYRRVCDEDGYALYFVEQILSLRGGEIGFEEYDPVKHVTGCQYGGVSAVVGLVS